MGKNLDERLVTTGVIPVIPAGGTLDVFADLLRKNQVVEPHFVDVEQGCEAIATHQDGYFTVWNKTASELTDIVWKAEFSHSIERDPVDPVPHVEKAGSVGPPSTPTAGDLLAWGEEWMDGDGTPVPVPLVAGVWTNLPLSNPGYLKSFTHNGVSYRITNTHPTTALYEVVGSLSWHSVNDTDRYEFGIGVIDADPWPQRRQTELSIGEFPQNVTVSSIVELAQNQWLTLMARNTGQEDNGLLLWNANLQAHYLGIAPPV